MGGAVVARWRPMLRACLVRRLLLSLLCSPPDDRSAMGTVWESWQEWEEAAGRPPVLLSTLLTLRLTVQMHCIHSPEQKHH